MRSGCAPTSPTDIDAGKKSSPAASHPARRLSGSGTSDRAGAMERLSTRPGRLRAAADFGTRSTRQLGGPTLLLGLLGIALALAGALMPRNDSANPPGATAVPRLLIAEPRSSGVQTLRPVDPLTLADLPGYTPLVIGAHRWHTPSPDGMMSALFVDDDSPAARRSGTVYTARTPAARSRLLAPPRDADRRIGRD